MRKLVSNGGAWARERGIPVECGWKNEEVGWEDCEA